MASNYEKRKVEILTKADQSEASINTLRTAARLLQNEMNKLERGSDEFRKSMHKWKEVDGRLKKAQAEVRGLDNEMGRLNRSTGGFMSQLKQIAGGVMVGNFFSFLGSQISSGINGMIASRKRISDEMADIAKTTNMTTQEVRELDKELGKLQTRTSKSALREIAVQAGKLGITGVENVRRFVEEMNQIQVALGEDLGEEAILQIGKMTNVYQAGAMQIGSAINSIGASSEASEQYLVDFAARLGGAARTAKISAPDIMGYGAVLDQMGLQVEMSATALSNFIIDFVKDTGKFEKAAGMQAGSLKKIIGEEGTNEGLLAFIRHLKSSTSGEDEFLQKLEQVGIDGSRGAAVFLTLSNNLGEVAAQQQLANEEFTKATSITDEYNKKNSNFAAQMEMLGKRLYEIFVDSSIMHGIESLIGWLYEMTKIPVSETMEEERLELQKLEFQLFDTNTKQEDRVKLIKTLQEKYPAYFGNLNAEKASYYEVSKAMRSVNDAMINRIVLQKKQEEVDKVVEKAANARINLNDAKATLTAYFNKAKAKYPQYDSEVTGGGDVVARSRIMVNRADSEKSKFLGKRVTELPPELFYLEKQLNLVYEYEEALKEYNIALTGVQREADKLREQLEGNSVFGDPSGSAAPGGGSGVAGGGNMLLSNNPKETVEAHKDALKEKVFDEKAALREVLMATVDNLEAWKDIEETVVMDRYAQGLISKEEQMAKLDDIELKHLYSLRDTYIAYGENVEAIDLRIATHKVNMMEKVKRASEKMEKDGTTRPRDFFLGSPGQHSTEKPEEKESWDTYATNTLNAYQGIIDLAAMREEAELQADRNVLKSRLDSIEAARNEGIMSEEAYLKKKAELEEQYNQKARALKRKQFERNRAAALIEAAINTAIGITKATPNPGLMILAGVTGALQAAAIAAQPVPEYAGGGPTVDVTGRSGRRYRGTRSSSPGGYFSQPTYIVGEAGGEFNVPNWLYTHPSAVNMMQALEATVANKDIRMLGNTGGNAEMAAAINKLNQRLDAGIQAHTNWDEVGYRKYLETWDRSERLSRF
jgi:TP901 family phage tail tape measure protein